MKPSKEGLTLTGALMAGLAASACCIGPVILAALGLGGAAFAVAFEPYRPWLIMTTTVLLGTGFWMVYRTPPEGACAPGDACPSPPRRTTSKVLLWLVTVLVMTAVLFPYYASIIF